MAGKINIGILALQGAVEPHQKHLSEIGVDSRRVLRGEHLEGLDGIILPGGESSTMLHLLRLNELWEPLREFVHGHPTFGVCAGAILLAQKVSGPTQESLGLMNLEAQRNAYGRQNESFIADIQPTENWLNETPFQGIFIRAPRLKATDSTPRPLFTHQSEPVMWEQGMALAASFHPELTESHALHRYFVDKVLTHKSSFNGGS